MAYTGHEEGRKIKSYIDGCGMKHKEICAHLNLSKSSFSRRYHGEFRWKTSELKKLAEVIGCSFYDLME